MAETKDGASALKKRANLGVVFLAIRSVLQSGIRFPAMIYLARTLTPADFGIFVTLQFGMSFLRTLGDGGLGMAMLQQKEKPRQEQLSSVFWAQLVIGVVMVGVAFALSPVFVSAFRLGDDVVFLMRLFSVSFLFSLLRGVPMLLMEREVNFGWVGVIETIGSLANYSVACIGAALGYGTGALVSGVLATTSITACSAFLVTRWRPSFFFRWSEIQPMLGFGLNFQGMHLLRFINDAVSPVLLGLGPGASVLGLVNFARSTSDIPADLVGTVRRVAFPYFARLQDDPKTFVAEFHRATAVAAIPVYFFLVIFVTAGDAVVSQVFAEKWLPAVPALLVFCAILTINFFGWIASAALEAAGAAAPVLRVTTLAVAITWVCVAAGTFYWPTPEGFAVGFAVQVPISMTLLYRLIRRRGYMIEPVRVCLPIGVSAALSAVFGELIRPVIPLDDLFGLGLYASCLAVVFLSLVAAMDSQLRKLAIGWLRRRLGYLFKMPYIRSFLEFWRRMKSGVAGPRCPAVPSQDSTRKRYQGTRLPLPTSAAPKVSVIIPVYGKFEVSYHCLRALASVPAGVDHEVIVVDDRSPDETLDMLASVDGLVVHENSENLGFIGACNAGAARASGEFLVFLNNDTWLGEGWLSALLDTFGAHPKAGVVGARLLFPDGRIQECGGMVFRDATADHFGRRAPLGPSEYNYVREVDYVSGACLMIPRALFEELGGFDSHFAPAYYEDTDLCFRARARGYQVLVQPAATVFHFEGWTHGKDKSSRAHKLMEINRARFFARWREVLKWHPTPGERSRRSIERARGSRVLLYSAAFSEDLLEILVQLRGQGLRPAWWCSAPLPAAVALAGVEPLEPREYPSLQAYLRSRPATVALLAAAPLDGAAGLRKIAPELLIVGVDGVLDPQLDAALCLEKAAELGGLNLPVIDLRSLDRASWGSRLRALLIRLESRDDPDGG